MPSSAARRKNYRWSKAEIDQLIELHALSFVPATPRGTLKELSRPRQRDLTTSLVKRLPDGTVSKLKQEAERLRRRMPTTEDLPPMMLDAVERSLPDASSFSTIVDACTLLAAVLGYGITDTPRKMPNRVSRIDRQWFWLSIQKQKDVFLDWTEIYEDVWNSSAWRECMRMRYGGRNRKTSTYLSPGERRDLETAAEQLIRESSAQMVTKEQLEDAAAKVGRGRFKSVVHHRLRKEYIAACARGGMGPDHWLNQRIGDSGFFERVAKPGLDTESLRKMLQDSFESRFCRYLQATPGSAEALLGEVLYHLMRLDSDPWQTPSGRLPDLPGVVWPPQLSPSIEEPTRDFETITSLYSENLNLSPVIFNHIWSAWVTLTARRFWEKRASTSMIVYWASRILEGLRPDVHCTYGRWIDHFHVNMLRPFMKMAGIDRRNLALQHAALDPFLHTLIRDPLLNCVFHGEVFGGRNQVFPHHERKRRDNRIRMQMIAFAVRLFRAGHFRRPAISVTGLLNDEIPLHDHVRQAAQPSPRYPRVSGKNLYAFVAPLVAAVINDPDWILTADNVKEIYHRYKDDPEVNQLLPSPPFEAVLMIGGKKI